jgi:hypothetical protein
MRLAIALILGFAAIGSSAAAGEPVAFGYGDEAGALSEIVVRRTQAYRVGANTDTSTLSKVYNATVERNAPGERRARVTVKDIRMEAVTTENPAVRLSGETEIYLMGALKSVPVILSVNDKGQLAGVVDWEATRQAVLKAVESRTSAMEGEKATLHAATTLAPDAVKKLDEQVAKGLTALVSKADQAAFLESFYDELAYFLMVAGERLEIGTSVERPMQARNPADGSLSTMKYVLTLRAIDPAKTTAEFDLKLAGDGIALLKNTMIAKLRKTKLGEDEIGRHVDAMSMHWDAEGTLAVDVKSGRLQKARVHSRIQAGDVEVITTQEADVTAAK